MADQNQIRRILLERFKTLGSTQWVSAEVLASELGVSVAVITQLMQQSNFDDGTVEVLDPNANGQLIARWFRKRNYLEAGGENSPGFHSDPSVGPQPVGGGVQVPDMLYDAQWIVDTYGATTAQEGDDLGDTGNMFAVGQRWKSQGLLDNYLDLDIRGGGATVIRHPNIGSSQGPPGEEAFIQLVGTTNPGEWLHPNRDGNDPAATEADFHPETFTYFAVAARNASSQTTGFRCLLGTRDLSANRGHALFFRESSGTRNLQVSFGTGSAIDQITGGVWTQPATTWYLIAWQYDGTSMKLWQNTLFDNPTVEKVQSYQPRNVGPSAGLETLQIGQDGDIQVRSHCNFSELRLFNRALNQADFDGVMNDLSTKFGIAVS
jgi:hypothetical protein